MKFNLRSFALFLLLIVTPLVSFSDPVERIINKEDADNIFSMTKPEWEIYVKRMESPQGSKMELKNLETGTGVMSFDEMTGTGLSIQPLYDNNDSTPLMLIVSSYYPYGFFPKDKDKILLDMKSAAQTDLGDAYSLDINFVQIPKFDVIDIELTKSAIPD